MTILAAEKVETQEEILLEQLTRNNRTTRFTFSLKKITGIGILLDKKELNSAQIMHKTIPTT